MTWQHRDVTALRVAKQLRSDGVTLVTPGLLGFALEKQGITGATSKATYMNHLIALGLLGRDRRPLPIELRNVHVKIPRIFEGKLLEVIQTATTEYAEFVDVKVETL